MSKYWKVIPGAVIGVIVLIFLAAIIWGVGNQDVLEGITKKSNTFKYALVKEGEEYRLHTLEKWSDSESDAVGLVTSCCNNRIWASYNTVVLYYEMPEYLPRGCIVCGNRP